MINNDNLQINQSLIKNNYYIVDNLFKDEFNIVIYFITNNKCKILIRRLDCIGWGQDLKIKLMDIKDDKFEKISLGSCEENLKIIEIYTKINLYSNKVLETIIPKVIIQTSNDIMNKNIFHYNSIMSFIDYNPDFEYKHFYDIDIREYIKNNSDEEDKENRILDAFDLLIPGVLKADLFKYFYLYKNGGCYFNCKMVLKKSLISIIKSDDKIILCTNDNKSLYSGLIMIEKNNINMYNCLKECVTNILNKNKFENKYQTTGHELFNKHFKDIKDIKDVKDLKDITKLNKKGDFIYNNDNNIILNYIYKNYYFNYYNTEKDLQFMWNNNKYFYEEAELINENNSIISLKYKFYTSVDGSSEKYKVIHVQNNIFKIVKANNNNSNHFIKMKIVDLLKDNIIYNDIGLLINNEKMFIIE